MVRAGQTRLLGEGMAGGPSRQRSGSREDTWTRQALSWSDLQGGWRGQSMLRNQAPKPLGQTLSGRCPS